MEFVEFLFSLCPPRLKTGEWERRFVTVCGELLNMWMDGASYAIRSRFVSDCPSDGLGYLGSDRVLIRGPAEPDAAWRARVDAAWETWPWAGSVAPEYGLIRQLAAFGYTDGTDVPVFLESQDVGAPSRASGWSRFWVVVPPTCHSYTTAVPTSDQELVKRILRQFRPGEVICDSVVFVVTGRLWDWNMPDTWDAWEALDETWDDNIALEVITT